MTESTLMTLVSDETNRKRARGCGVVPNVTRTSGVYVPPTFSWIEPLVPNLALPVVSSAGLPM